MVEWWLVVHFITVPANPNIGRPAGESEIVVRMPSQSVCKAILNYNPKTAGTEFLEGVWMTCEQRPSE